MDKHIPNGWSEKVLILLISVAIAWGIMQATVSQNTAMLQKLDEEKASKELVNHQYKELMNAISNLRQDLKDERIKK
jgi:hypothetical protein